MPENNDQGLYNDPLLAQFYDSASHNRLDFEFCLGLAAKINGRSVLDLGCGTGELAVQMAEYCHVTAVEPAVAMLDIARKRDDGQKVNWVEGCAKTVRLAETFDLIVLTGHSFQVFLTDEDQMAVLKTIAFHLRPEGRFIFDSRNPDFVNLKSRAKDQVIRRLNHAGHGEIEMWNESEYNDDTNILTYRNGFKIVATGDEYAASEQIHYTGRAKLADMLQDCGLKVSEWYGDWVGTEYRADAREIIPLGGLDSASI